MRAVLLSVASGVVVLGTFLESAPRQGAAPAPMSTAPAGSVCADAHAVVQRAAAYVEQFGRDLRGVLAVEDYRQKVVGALLRFAFTVSDDRASNARACSVTFQETGSPTIVRSGVGGDMPASGTFSIDPATGRVGRSELIAGNSSAGVASKATVQYELDRKLQLWLPRQMREEYRDRSGERIDCEARYSYRRAEVTVAIRPGV